MNNQTIRALRKKLGLSQRQFAERLGVKRRTIIRWESSLRTPNQEFQRKERGKHRACLAEGLESMAPRRRA